MYGSCVEQARPDSDVDLLLVTRRSMTLHERECLIAVLLEVSGWRGHRRRFPDVAHRRPIELTSLVLDRLWTQPRQAHRDFQFGEWLRGEIVDGRIPQPTNDPDVVLLMAAARARHRLLLGPALADVLPDPPPAHVREAALMVMPGTIANAGGDERNALLTMARILVTVQTARIVAKDVAAAMVIPSLSLAEQALMERARLAYLHGGDDDWTADAPRVRDVLQRLARRAAHTPEGPR